MSSFSFPTKGLSNKQGFSLVEMLVSVSIFAIVMTAATGAIMEAINANRKSQSLDLVTGNIQTAIDQMRQEVQRGGTYHCGSSGSISEPQSCSDGKNWLAFEPSGGDPEDDSDQIVYTIQNNQIVRSEDGGNTFEAITAPSLTVNSLQFFTTAAPSSDEGKKRIQIVADGESEQTDETQSEFTAQTTASQLDIQTILPTYGQYSQNIYCPIQKREGQVLLDFTDQKTSATYEYGVTTHPEQDWNAWRGPFKLPEAVDTNRPFTVKVVTWDHHCDENGENCESPDPGERIFVELWNGTYRSSKLFESDLTQELPADTNTLPAPWDVNEDVTISKLGEYVTFEVMARKNGNQGGSVVPACVSFEYNDIDPEIDIEEF